MTASPSANRRCSAGARSTRRTSTGCRALGIGRDEIVDSTWRDNGPGWMAILLGDAAASSSYGSARRSTWTSGSSGCITRPPRRARGAAAWPEHGSIVQDPATGSLNASVARWLIDTGRIQAPYIATQGGAIGRAAGFTITQDPDGTVLVGGRSVTLVEGSVDL